MEVFSDGWIAEHDNRLYRFVSSIEDFGNNHRCHKCDLGCVCDGGRLSYERRQCNMSVRRDGLEGYWMLTSFIPQRLKVKEVIDNRSDDDKLVCELLLG
jgi:hypothetical protein